MCTLCACRSPAGPSGPSDSAGTHAPDRPEARRALPGSRLARGPPKVRYRRRDAHSRKTLVYSPTERSGYRQSTYREPVSEDKRLGVKAVDLLPLLHGGRTSRELRVRTPANRVMGCLRLGLTPDPTKKSL